MENAPAPLAHPLLSAPQFILDWHSWAAWSAPTKRPLDLKRSLKAASVTDKDTWASWAFARIHLSKVTEVRATLPVSAGVGLLVQAPLVFVDFDDLSMDPAGPPTAGWAHEFLTKAANLGAFTEWSGSGCGAHAFFRVSSKFPTLTRNRYTRSNDAGEGIGIEVYSSARFAALTGHPYAPGVRPELNDPAAGEALLLSFIAELNTRGAPILAPAPTPINVARPSAAVTRVALTLLENPRVAAAFSDPQRAYAEWASTRLKSNSDDSLSAWRFSLYLSAARGSALSPAPLYELFNPFANPLHPGVPVWQEFSGYLKKKHRVYMDIQRAHALAAEEQRLLALDLGESFLTAAAVKPSVNHAEADQQTVDSWAQLGLVLKTSQNGNAFPITSSVNFIRVLSRHSYFKQFKIERNQLDGTTRVNREPLGDTFPTRCLEPMRSILDMHKDPPVDSIWSAIEVVADDNPYDPLREYLDSLPDFNPDKPLLSSWLTEIGAAHSPDIERFSRRILVGLVARALKPGVKFDYVPVFEGPQGVGKSTLVEKLVSTPFYAVMVGDLQSKDALISLRGKWALELAELQSFKRADEEQRKAFFSTSVDSFRPPYGRANVAVERRCILFGTTNDKRYMTDYTGARRYLPISFPTPIDIPWFEDNRDALFAEAKALFLSGAVFHDTWQEQNSPERARMMEERMVTPAWHTRIMDHLVRLPAPHLPDAEHSGFSGIVTTQDVANLKTTLDLPQAVQNMSDAQLASFLRRAGFGPMPLAYRRGGTTHKTYGWGHPHLQRLLEDEQKAFLSNFPSLFEGEVPPKWLMLQEVHLASAMDKLQPTPESEYDS